MARVTLPGKPIGELYLIQPAAQLVSLAWAAPDLSAEQLRTYVVRLRRHLASLSVPARLVSEPRRGYGLVFTS